MEDGVGRRGGIVFFIQFSLLKGCSVMFAGFVFPSCFFYASACLTLRPDFGGKENGKWQSMCLCVSE